VLRILVVGAGTIAQSVHLPAISQDPNTDLVGVVDISPIRAQALSQAYGVPHFPSLEVALSEIQVDAVILCVPGEQAGLAEQALTAGLHVLSEKPLALSPHRARELGDLAMLRDLVLWVGYMKMEDPILQSGRALLERIGEVQLVVMKVHHPADETATAHVRLFPAGGEDPARVADLVAANEAALTQVLGPDHESFRRLYADVMMGSVVHQFSVLRALGYKPPTSYFHADAWPWPAHGRPPNLLAVGKLVHESNPRTPITRVVIEWVWGQDAPAYTESIEFVGSGGTLRIDLAAPYLLEAASKLTIGLNGPTGHVSEIQFGDHFGSYRHQLTNFVHAITGDGPITSTAAGAAADAEASIAFVRAVAATFQVTLGGEDSL